MTGLILLIAAAVLVIAFVLIAALIDSMTPREFGALVARRWGRSTLTASQLAALGQDVPGDEPAPGPVAGPDPESAAAERLVPPGLAPDGFAPVALEPPPYAPAWMRPPVAPTAEHPPWQTAGLPALTPDVIAGMDESAAVLVPAGTEEEEQQ